MRLDRVFQPCQDLITGAIHATNGELWQSSLPCSYCGPSEALQLATLVVHVLVLRDDSDPNMAWRLWRAAIKRPTLLRVLTVLEATAVAIHTQAW